MTSAGVEHFSGRIHPGRGSPARILRAAQFHEFVGQMMEWGRRGDTFVVPRMRTQLVAARTVAEALAELALAPDAPTYSEIAGPREESLPDMARLLAGGMRIVEVSDPADSHVYESGALLPRPETTLAGPTFIEWLTFGQSRAAA
jgi:hypothetical protein